jgi:xanthine dehydrogenase accessory factor
MPRVLVAGGGDMGSAVAHALFQRGAKVLVSERPRSPHARRGMAFTDALFDGEARLEGVTARYVHSVTEVEACWYEGACIPLVTLPETLLASAIAFDALVEATMRREDVRPDLRGLAGLMIGLGPGYTPGVNCDVAVETQWGESMGRVLRDRPTAPRAGGPRALDGVTRERFVIATIAGTWRTDARLGQPVQSGDVLGHLEGEAVRAPIAGHLRGLSRDGVEVLPGTRLIEVDPRREPQISGLGERPRAVARGVIDALVERFPVLRAAR